MLPRTPRTLLAQILSAHFPMISGPQELDQVVPQLEERGGEFCGCLDVSTEMVAHTCAAGFLPMSESFTGHTILLVKSHRNRCVHDLSSVHVSRSDARRARGTTLRFGADFAGCLRETVAAHSERWLTDPLCEALMNLYSEPRHGVEAVSVELYRGDQMIAGEIGYRVGGVYTSMSGFYHETGAGKVQLLALAVALRESGFGLWDLGMPMEYKLSLGAQTLSRRAFIDLYRDRALDQEQVLTTVDSCHALLQRERELGRRPAG